VGLSLTRRDARLEGADTPGRVVDVGLEVPPAARDGLVLVDLDLERVLGGRRKGAASTKERDGRQEGVSGQSQRRGMGRLDNHAPVLRPVVWLRCVSTDRLGCLRYTPLPSRVARPRRTTV
jgi:hypothetical protein